MTSWLNRDRRRRALQSLAAIVGLSVSCALAHAQASPPPAPYSLPWQLRPAAATTVVRSDTAFAQFQNPMTGADVSTVTSMLLGSYKLTDNFAPMVRLGLTSNMPPDAMGQSQTATVFLNPVLGGTYVFKLAPELRIAAFLGVALPFGGGGGDSPDPKSAAARGAAGIYSRSAMDNAMFAVNDLVIFPGVDVAFVAHGVTVQLEATALQLTRVRGAKNQVDSSRTNFTAGLHVGYFFIPQISAGAELRYQRWLSTPDNIKKDMTGTLRDTTTMAIGLRFHYKLSDSVAVRPGVSYARGLDDPMAKSHYDIFQLDIPVQF